MKNGCANRRIFEEFFLWSGMPSNIQEFFRNIFFLIIPGLFLIIPDQDKKWLELGDGTAGGAGND